MFQKANTTSPACSSATGSPHHQRPQALRSNLAVHMWQVTCQIKAFQVGTGPVVLTWHPTWQSLRSPRVQWTRTTPSQSGPVKVATRPPSQRRELLTSCQCGVNPIAIAIATGRRMIVIIATIISRSRRLRKNRLRPCQAFGQLRSRIPKFRETELGRVGFGGVDWKKRCTDGWMDGWMSGWTH